MIDTINLKKILSEEKKGPNINAADQAIDGFIRSNKIEKKDLFKKKLKKVNFIFLKQNLNH